MILSSYEVKTEIFKVTLDLAENAILDSMTVQERETLFSCHGGFEYHSTEDHNQLIEDNDDYESMKIDGYSVAGIILFDVYGPTQEIRKNEAEHILEDIINVYEDYKEEQMTHITVGGKTVCLDPDELKDLKRQLIFNS